MSKDGSNDGIQVLSCDQVHVAVQMADELSVLITEFAKQRVSNELGERIASSDALLDLPTTPSCQFFRALCEGDVRRAKDIMQQVCVCQSFVKWSNGHVF